MVAKGVAILAFALLAACTTAKGSFCDIEHPIRLSAAAVDAMSDEEVKTVLAHNVRGEKLCGWAP